MSVHSVRVYRRSFGAGPPCRVIEIRADHLDLRRLQAPSRLRARDAAHILALQTGASVEALALPSLAVRALRAPAALRRHGGDTYPSLRSALSAWWARTDPHDREALLGRDSGDLGRFVAHLRRRGLIATHRHLVAGELPRLLAPIGTFGYVRQLGHILQGALLLNTHYFLYDPRELDNPLAAIGDPVGMLASHGQIRVAPILRRATLTLAGGRWQVQQLGADDLAIDLPDGTTLSPMATDGPQLRYRGDTAQADVASGAAERPRPSVSPSAREASVPDCEVCLQGRYVSMIRRGGALDPPHGALVLSFATPPGERLLRTLEARPTVQYRIPRIPDLNVALQAGPQLIRGGQVVLHQASFVAERFRTIGTADPTAPLVFPTDTDRTRAGRIGIGVTSTNSLVILAVQGTSSLSDTGSEAPLGCTLTELSEALLEAGAVEALNCDGGGSTQVFAGPGVLLSSTDARAVPGALFDRPLPVAAVC